jgi:hypothetical protein
MSPRFHQRTVRGEPPAADGRRQSAQSTVRAQCRQHPGNPAATTRIEDVLQNMNTSVRLPLNRVHIGYHKRPFACIF